MSLVNILNVIVKESKMPFEKNLSFEVYFESIKALPEPIEWKVIYVGQASDDQFDQVLDEAEMPVD